MGMPQPFEFSKRAWARSHPGERPTRRLRPFGGMRVFGLALFVVGSLFLPRFAPGEPAEQRSFSDREVKATYFFRLSNFFDWPDADWPAEGKPLQACLIGRDPFHDALDFFDGKTVRGRLFQVRRLSSIQESRDCHLLYIGVEGRAQIRSILLYIRDRSVLSVGDGIEFARLGGSVGFVVEDRRVRLALNPDAAQRSGLVVSSKLLEVSSIVRGSSQ
jgi:hypothetical protein